MTHIFKTMKSIPTCLAVILFTITLLPQASHAQTSGAGSKNDASETTGPKRFWQASLPGGSYIVALDRISSVSKHSYIIDGNISVTEVVIDTSGNSLVRFYYLEPVGQDATTNIGAGITQRGKELLDAVGQRAGSNITSAVVKQYPTTTHAKTVEFRVSGEGALDKLYDSVRNAWINGKGRKFTIKTDN